MMVLVNAIPRRLLAFGEIKSGVRNGEATSAIFYLPSHKNEFSGNWKEERVKKEKQTLKLSSPGNLKTLNRKIVEKTG